MFSTMYFDRWSSRRTRILLGVSLGMIWFWHFSSLRTFDLDDLNLDLDDIPHLNLLHNPTNNNSPKPQQSNLTYLTQTLNLSPTFTYASRTIRTKFYKGERPDITWMNTTLFPPPSLLERGSLEGTEIGVLPPLTVHVPQSPQIDTGIFIFGIATTIPRLNISLPQLTHWLPPTTPLHIIAPPHPSPSLISTQAAEMHMNISITTSDLPFPIAYFSLIKLLLENRRRGTKWLVLMDDDTFIPSLPTLAAHLEANYDEEKEVLVAALTEDKRQIEKWGLIPFGGGGIFISIPLALHLTRPEIWDECIGGLGHEQGDGILGACLEEFVRERPRFEGGLWQMDFRGDVAGVFEAGRRLLSVHHWRSWFQLDVVKAAVVSEVCGDEGLWMRWGFEGGWVVSNGFSVVEFLGGMDGVDGVEGLEKVDLEAVEMTWDGEKEIFLHRIGPIRGKDREGRKRRFVLVDAQVVEGGVRQLYLCAGNKEGVGDEGMDRVVELFWEKG